MGLFVSLVNPLVFSTLHAYLLEHKLRTKENFKTLIKVGGIEAADYHGAGLPGTYFRTDDN